MEKKDEIMGDIPPHAILEPDYTDYIPGSPSVDQSNDSVPLRSAFHYAGVLLSPHQHFHEPHLIPFDNTLDDETELQRILEKVHTRLQEMSEATIQLLALRPKTQEAREQRRLDFGKVALNQSNIRVIVEEVVREHVSILSTNSAGL